jgi:hypothetical protein
MQNDTKNLESFLLQQDSSALVRVLMELATDYLVVRERLDRLKIAHAPALVAQELMSKLEALRDSRKYYTWREATGFAHELEIWLDQVEREVLSNSPSVAAELFESFIESDVNWFEMVDDSGGSVGDIMRAACEHWLRAAQRCEGPVEMWTTRLEGLHFSDQYGARDALMGSAHLLLDDAGLRQMVRRFTELSTGDQRLCLAVTGKQYEAYKLSAVRAAIQLLNEAIQSGSDAAT